MTKDQRGSRTVLSRLHVLNRLFKTADFFQELKTRKIGYCTIQVRKRSTQ